MNGGLRERAFRSFVRKRLQQTYLMITSYNMPTIYVCAICFPYGNGTIDKAYKGARVGFFFRVRHIRATLPTPLARSLGYPPRNLVRGTTNVLYQLVQKGNVHLSTQHSFFHSIFKGLFGFFVHYLPPLTILQFRSFTRLIRPHIRVVTVIRVVHFTYVPLFCTSSMTRRMLMKATSMVLRFYSKAMGTSSFRRGFTYGCF